LDYCNFIHPKEAEMFCQYLLDYSYIINEELNRKFTLDSYYIFQSTFFMPRLDWVPDDLDHFVYLSKKNLKQGSTGLSDHETELYNEYTEIFKTDTHQVDELVSEQERYF
jgi:hypothetical protein